jgi:glc operon protein GlcG
VLTGAEELIQQQMTLGQDEAQLAIQVMRDELTKRRLSAVLAVADAHGELIALLRMDGSYPASILVATNKAWTAARERKPTRELGQAARDAKDGFDMAYYGDRRYIGWGGGLPVTVDDAVVGAVAVSGLTESQDIEIAMIGINAILKSLNKPLA